MSAKRARTAPGRTKWPARQPSLRGWARDAQGGLVSPPTRCKRHAWYLARARLTDGVSLSHAALLTTFLNNGKTAARHCLRLHAIENAGGCRDLLGWLETPPDATHMQVRVPRNEGVGQIAAVTFHPVSERDPKCHPWANVPRWCTYRTALPIQRVVLPVRLASLADALSGLDVRTLAAPRSLAELRRAARGAACVVDPQWITKLGLGLTDLERLASRSWLLVDLATLARLVSDTGAADAPLITHAATSGLMSARVEYADVPTRGLALQDVVPYSALDRQGRFCTRGIKANRSWRQYADDTGFATLLSSETPWTRQHGDVLSAMRAIGAGELIATDLPWLVAGVQGPLLAPQLAAHLLRMHLAAPIAEHLQYWTRWEDANTIVREIAELARRYTPLRAVRWASSDPARAHLGITLALPGDRPTRHSLFCTGRMDSLEVHDGLPPEPMMIFMKWLAREAREQTAWARQHLAGKAVTWRFATADGLKYAVNYDAEPEIAPPPETVRVRMDLTASKKGVRNLFCEAPPGPLRGKRFLTPFFTLTDDEGLHGDRSLLFQDTLTRQLRQVIEGRAPAGGPGRTALLRAP